MARPLCDRIQAWVETERSRLVVVKQIVSTIIVRDTAAPEGIADVTRVDGVEEMNSKQAADAVEAQLILYAPDPLPTKGKTFDLYLLNNEKKVLRGPFGVTVKAEHVEAMSGEISIVSQLGANTPEARAAALQAQTWMGAVAAHARIAQDERAHTLNLTDRVLKLVDVSAGSISAMNAALQSSTQTHEHAVRIAESRALAETKRADEWEARATKAEAMCVRASEHIEDLTKKLQEAIDGKVMIRDAAAILAKQVSRDIKDYIEKGKREREAASDGEPNA